jgi:hypothetical protein
VFKGGDVELTTWGQHETLAMQETCAKEPGATFHQVTKDTCFSTGVHADRIFWKRGRLLNGTYYFIRYEYPTARKSEMDPIVTATYASWIVKGPPHP